ncbi:hypothetical protein Micbo1qcDRAFT_1331 [Microdochium bolleyi]|uniref:Uncharacterized protein n=1 Tax=Microdochium bolleyi TaxID=196109 RepID=A0A136JHH3_9PEZI|nr:hypothetical protein Micbo1qcDRAFT_1331 [Microdochium bolleyi]
MAPGAPAYCQVAQDDEPTSLKHGAASPTSLSPAPSTSPMPLLPTAKTLTPLSMTSDDDLLHANSLKPIFEEDAADVPTSCRSHDGGAPTTTLYEPQARATAAAASAPTAPDGGTLQYEPVAPGRRTTNPITTETGLSHSPTFSPSAGTQSARHLSSSPPADASKPVAAPVPIRPQPSASLSIESSPGPAAAVAAAGAARARSATNSSNRNRLQSLSPESPSTSGIIQPHPIVRTASTKSVSLLHPAPDITLPRSRASSIARLEATAERLSMTSSIEDAIRDLHDEQKRIDSRRSSILAASVASATDGLEQPPPFPRQVSGTSSILEINNAARQGGYSPAAYVMSPASSIRSTTSRLRSGSTGLYKTTTLEDMEETHSPLSRHGPGKGSVHSVMSVGKPAVLTNIAELEPTALTQAAMDAADQLPELPTGDDSTLRIPPMDPADRTPNAHQFNDQTAMDYWDQAIADAKHEPAQEEHDEDARSIYAGSTCTYEQAERAFADFDGTHASPDVDNEDVAFMPSFEQVQQGRVSFLMPLDHDMHDEERDVPASNLPLSSQPQRLSAAARPKSYLDPDTGNTMLYYPARVPMMLNVPQRLSQKPKAETRNKRRTQVLTDMSDINRKSGMSWLPEFHNEPLMDPILDGATPASNVPPTAAEPEAITPELPSPSPRLEQAGETQPMLRENPPTMNDEARKSQMSLMPNADKRKSRMSNLGMLPPQLRASAFFDLPSETANLELKDGSATATLDSILDASAAAPVSAFTDHAFAGTLGSEVYGTEKKRKSTINRLSTADTLGVGDRRSRMHLRKPSALSRHSRLAESVRSGSLKSDGDRDDERTRLSESIDGRQREDRDSEDENDEEEGEEEEDEEELYQGPPTTLLAELQIRKQQQKLRTRAPAQAYPNGMYSTLLEMDAVAEVERRARKGKKINLAWEAPRAGDEGESDDEDLPLGLILATKSQGNLAAAVAELHRPMGLMEKREMEENEPLSQRRNRLLGPHAPPLRQPQSMASLGYERGAPGLLQPHSPRLDLHTPEEDENEEETLGARKARLQAREKSDSALPEARPVSTAFSTELLTAFKGDEAETISKDKEPTKATEEEETLGQRRRRLQAEREAREQEMGANGMLGISVQNDSLPLRLPKKHSMADVLGAHGNRVVSDDPRAIVEKMKAADGERYKQEQDRKFAAYRSQLPTNLSTPNLQTPGGYMSGRFNDGTGGGLGQARSSMALGSYNEPQRQIGNPYLMNAVAPMQNYMQPGYNQQGYGQPGFMAPSYSNPALGAPGFVPAMMNPYGMNMAGQPQPLDRVEQWRQSVRQ